jgi:hypothetical protein
VNVQADLNSLTDTERQIQNKIKESKLTQTDRKRRIINLEWQIQKKIKEKLRFHRQTDRHGRITRRENLYIEDS